VRDAEAQREVDENAAGDAEIRPEVEAAPVDQAPEVDEPAPKKRKQGREKGYNTPKAEIERQEQIKEAMEYRLMVTPTGRSPSRWRWRPRRLTSGSPRAWPTAARAASALSAEWMSTFSGFFVSSLLVRGGWSCTVGWVEVRHGEVV